MSFVPINKIVYLELILALLPSIYRCNLLIVALLKACTIVCLIPVTCHVLNLTKKLTKFEWQFSQIQHGHRFLKQI